MHLYTALGTAALGLAGLGLAITRNYGWEGTAGPMLVGAGMAYAMLGLGLAVYNREVTIE